MSLLQKYSITQVLYCLLGVFIIGFVTLSILTGWQIGKVIVKGPLYNRITQGKDIIADILPPPVYIIESYLNVQELLNEADPKKIEILLQNTDQLKKEYNDRHNFWSNKLNDEALAKTLLEESYFPALEFYKIRDTEFIPAIKLGNLSKARELALGKMKVAYELHRSKIDLVVKMANKRINEDEIKGEKSIKQTVWIVVSLAFLFLSSLTFLYSWAIRQIGNLLNQIL
jgi:methyl-accepting chemotaxis protein